MSKIIEAELVGVVHKVLVSPGDQVDEGDVVVSLESMKMEIPIETDDAGTVAEIHVSVGDSVKPGDPIVTLS